MNKGGGGVLVLCAGLYEVLDKTHRTAQQRYAQPSGYAYKAHDTCAQRAVRPPGPFPFGTFRRRTLTLRPADCCFFFLASVFGTLLSRHASR